MLQSGFGGGGGGGGGGGCGFFGCTYICNTKYVNDKDGTSWLLSL